MKKYQIKSEHSLIRCFLRSCSGRFWDISYPGGAEPYLSDVDQALFKICVLEHMENLNCITTTNAIALAFTLKDQRVKSAIELLNLMQLPKLIKLIALPEFPSIEWLTPFCKSIKIKICRPQTIEIARRYFCNQAVINEFFDCFSPILMRDPRLIWNADETQLSTTKRFKVLCESGKLPLVTSQAKLPIYNS
jgi:hypothetical protein